MTKNITAGKQAKTLTAKASGVNNNALTYRINEAQLLLYAVKLSSAQSDKMGGKLKRGVNLPFITYSVERVNVDQIQANQTYDRQFELEPGCLNVMTMNPLISEDDPFLSRQDNIANYRWNLNGINTTSHDVVPYNALYLDRFLNSMASGGVKVNNLRFVCHLLHCRLS